MKLFAAFIALLFSIPNLPAAQQPSPPAPSGPSKAATLLAQSLAAQTGQVALSDVTLSGTAHRIAGSDDESGTAVLKATANGQSRIDLNLLAGPRSEIHGMSPDGPAGSWSGPDSVSHPIAYHNLVSEPAWFFPAIVVAQGLSATGYVVTYIGHETHNSTAVEHISLSQQPSGSLKTVALLRHLSQVEVYLDSTTLLPAAMTFNIHPDDDAGRDIPIEIRFSDYRTTDSAQVPFHIQKFLNNSLTLDFQVQSVMLNTGLAASTFNAQ
jgi:hypothetical protein